MLSPEEVAKRNELKAQAMADHKDTRLAAARAAEKEALKAWSDSQRARDAAVARRATDTELSGLHVRVVVAHAKLMDAEAGLAGRSEAFNPGSPGLDPDEQAALTAALENSQHQVDEARSMHEAALAAVEQRTAELDVAVATATVRMDKQGIELETKIAAHKAALDSAVQDRYTAQQAERQKVFCTADAKTAQVRSEAANLIKDAEKQSEKARVTLQQSRDAYLARKARYETGKIHQSRRSIKVARQRVNTARNQLDHSRREFADELATARKNGVEPPREAVYLREKDIEHHTQRLRDMIRDREALLEAVDGHQAELREAQEERDSELGLSGRGKRQFLRDVVNRATIWRELLDDYERAARSDLTRDAEQRVERDEAACEAARANHVSALREACEMLWAEMKVAGWEYIRACDDGLLDPKTANDHFKKLRGPVSEQAAKAMQDLGKMLGLGETTPQQLISEVLSGDEPLKRFLASVEIVSSNRGKDVNTHRGQPRLASVVNTLALVVDTEAIGRRVSAQMACGNTQAWLSVAELADDVARSGPCVSRVFPIQNS